MDIVVTGAISAVSALHPALAVLLTAWEYFQQVRYSKAKCRSLITRAQRILHEISVAIKDNRCDSSVNNLLKLENNLLFVRNLMITQASMSFLKSLLRLDDINATLEEGHRLLEDCLTCFQIHAQVNIEKHIDEYEAARKEDALELKGLCVQLLQNEKKLLNHLNIKDEDVPEAMLAMQRELTQSNMLSDQRTLIEQSLVALQHSTRYEPPKETPKWAITRYDVDIDADCELGGGGFGVVTKAQWNGLDVAVKRMKTANVKALVREVETWISLRHDHIVPCYGASTSADPPFIVLRYMQHGHLLQYLHTFSDANRVRLVFGVSLGLRYLHGERIVHGDIKGVNILVDDAGKACITDFGLAFKVESARKDEPPKRAAGTLRYMAPELIKTGRLAYATDVYAFGMLIYETFTGRPPFLLDSDSDVHSGHLMLERPEALEIRDRGLTDEMWDLLQACASREAVNRPTARDITTRTTSMAKKWSPRSPLTNASTASDNPHSAGSIPLPSSGTHPASGSGRAQIQSIPMEDTASSSVSSPPSGAVRSGSGVLNIPPVSSPQNSSPGYPETERKSSGSIIAGRPIANSPLAANFSMSGTTAVDIPLSGAVVPEESKPGPQVMERPIAIPNFVPMRSAAGLAAPASGPSPPTVPVVPEYVASSLQNVPVHSPAGPGAPASEVDPVTSWTATNHSNASVASSTRQQPFIPPVSEYMSHDPPASKNPQTVYSDVRVHPTTTPHVVQEASTKSSASAVPVPSHISQDASSPLASAWQSGTKASAVSDHRVNGSTIPPPTIQHVPGAPSPSAGYSSMEASVVSDYPVTGSTIPPPAPQHVPAAPSPSSGYSSTKASAVLDHPVTGSTIPPPAPQHVPAAPYPSSGYSSTKASAVSDHPVIRDSYFPSAPSTPGRTPSDPSSTIQHSSPVSVAASGNSAADSFVISTPTGSTQQVSTTHGFGLSVDGDSTTGGRMSSSPPLTPEPSSTGTTAGTSASAGPDHRPTILPVIAHPVSEHDHPTPKHSSSESSVPTGDSTQSLPVPEHSNSERHAAGRSLTAPGAIVRSTSEPGPHEQSIVSPPMERRVVSDSGARKLPMPLDGPAFCLKTRTTRARATILFNDRKIPVVQSGDIEKHVYPDSAVYRSSEDFSFSATVSYHTRHDEETWKLIGPSITRTGPNIDMRWRFANEELAHDWFAALFAYAKRKEKKSILPAFMNRSLKRLSPMTVEWRFHETQWRRMVEGKMMHAPWEPSKPVPEEPRWNYVPMPHSSKMVTAFSAADSFSFIEEFKDRTSRYWTVKLRAAGEVPVVRKEGCRTEGSEVLYIEEYSCDTPEIVREWFNLYRWIIESIAASTARKHAPVTLSQHPRPAVPKSDEQNESIHVERRNTLTADTVWPNAE